MTKPSAQVLSVEPPLRGERSSGPERPSAAMHEPTEEPEGSIAKEEEGERHSANTLREVVSAGGLASRRQFIQIGLAVLGLGVAGEGTWVLFKALSPGARGEPEPVEVLVTDMAVGGTKGILYGSDPAIVMRLEEGFLVLSMVCTHLGCIVK